MKKTKILCVSALLMLACEFKTEGETSATGLVPSSSGASTGQVPADDDDTDVSASGTTDSTTDSTTNGVTSNGVTTASDVTGSTITISDGDSSSDETGEPPIPPQCQETGFCVEPPPTDWFGPVGVGLVNVGSRPLECPAGFREVLRGSQGIQADAPECGCNCNGDAADCSVDFAAHDTAACDSEVVASTATSDCQMLNIGVSAESFDADTPVASGSCNPQSTTNLTPATFVRDVLVCSTVGGMICNAERVSGFCVAEAGGDLDGRYCIHREGNHPCPDDGLYTDRVRVFQEIDDQRGCSECTCAPPQLGDCDGEARVFGDAACNTQTALLNDGCTETPGLGASFSVQYEGNPPSIDCSVENDSMPTGEASGTGLTTLCCSGPA